MGQNPASIPITDPMGRQIQLYLTPSDINNFEAALRRKIDFEALVYRTDGPWPSRVSSLAVGEEIGKTWLTLFLVRPEDVDVLRFREVPTQGYWTLDVLSQPIIEFSRPYFDGSIMRQGRFYYQTGDYNDIGTWVEKPRCFLDWADQIFKTTKKNLRRHRFLDAYLGPEAWELHSNKQVEFSQR